MYIYNTYHTASDSVSKQKGIAHLVQWGVLFILFSGAVLMGNAQSIVLSDGQLGGTITLKHTFTRDLETFDYKIENALSGETTVEVVLADPRKIGRSAYNLISPKKVRLRPGESQYLRLSIDYGKWIDGLTLANFEIYEYKENVPSENLLLTLSFEFSATAKLFFWDHSARKFATSLPDIELENSSESASDKLIELRRNGNGNLSYQFIAKNNFYESFKLYSNDGTGRQVLNGDQLDLKDGVQSFVVKFRPSEGEENSSDDTWFTFKEVGGSGSEVSVKLRGKVAKNGIVVKDELKVNENPVERPDPSDAPLKIPEESVTDTTAKEDEWAWLERGEILDSLIMDSIMYHEIENLCDFFDRMGGITPLRDTIATFNEKWWEMYMSVPYGFDLVLEEHPAFVFRPNHVKKYSENDNKVEKIEVSQDSIKNRLVSIMIPSKKINFKDKSSRMEVVFDVFFKRGEQLIPVSKTDIQHPMTFGLDIKHKRQPLWWFWSLILLGIGLVIGFIYGRMKLNRPVLISEFKHRARPRPKNDEPVQAKTVTIDLNEDQMEVIELEFNEDLPPVKIATPLLTQSRRLLKKIFLIFRTKERYAVDAIYHSLRIEPIMEELPAGLELNNNRGLFLLETDMTEDILSNNHQEFEVNDVEIDFWIYIDPTEIVHYSGRSKVLYIPFKVIEESFDGYTRYEKFIVPVKINPRKFKA